MKKWLVRGLAMLVMLGLTGCQTDNQPVPDLLEPVGVQMDTAQVKRGSIRSVSDYDGAIVPHVEELKFSMDGTVNKIYVTLGQKVEKGQVLAELNEEKILKQMETLEAEISEITTLGGFSDRQAKADIAIAQKKLEKMQAEGASAQNCALQEIEIEELELAFEQTQELRQLKLEEKQRILKGLREKTGKNQLIAPVDGRIVYIGVSNEGVAVQSDSVVMCIADDSRLYLQTKYIPKTTINNAQAYYARIGDQDCEVSYVPYDDAEYLSMVLAGETIVSNFLVKKSGLESGQFAVLMIEDRHKEDVLTVPVNALYRDAGGQYVYKIENGRTVRCAVSVGITSDTAAEITEGLKEGDLVYVKG